MQRYVGLLFKIRIRYDDRFRFGFFLFAVFPLWKKFKYWQQKIIRKIRLFLYCSSFFRFIKSLRYAMCFFFWRNFNIPFYFLSNIHTNCTAHGACVRSDLRQIFEWKHLPLSHHYFEFCWLKEWTGNGHACTQRTQSSRNVFIYVRSGYWYCAHQWMDRVLAKK